VSPLCFVAVLRVFASRTKIIVAVLRYIVSM